MTSTALLVEALPAGSDSLRARVDVLEALLDDVAGADFSCEDDAGLVEVARRLSGVAARVAAAKLAVVAEVDRRSAARRATGATSTAAWLRADGMSAGAAQREVRLAGSLAGHDATRQALQRGQINAEQATVITSALDELSDAVPQTDRTATESALLEQAGRLDPGQLRNAARAAAARIDPTGSGDLAAQERAAKARRDLALWRGPDGMHHIRGVLDTEGLAFVAAALDPLAAPATDDGRDTRTPGRRRADALVELARRALAGGGLPVSGGVHAQVLVTMSVEQLRGQLDGCAQLAASVLREPISAAAARRIACTAGIVPVVLGTGSQVLDLGRSARLASPAQRRALAVRDGGCTAPG